MRIVPLILVATAVAGDASAQHFVCTAVRRGDTAAQLARRLTSAADNRHEWWFQILDPAASRFVSKASYDLIRPGWQVCIAADAAGGRPMPRSSVQRDSVSAPARGLDRAAEMHFDYSWLLLAGGLAPVLATPFVMKYLDERRAMLDCMSAFASSFVKEFERPLPRRHAADRPIASRVRYALHQARVDVLLAPSAGHSYPNVSDHLHNLAYDIDRVLKLVPDSPFACGPPRARGDWVVIPFHMKASRPKSAT